MPEGSGLVVPLAGLGRTDRAQVGGKCAGLGELLAAGADVPDGFAVTPAAAASPRGDAAVRAAYVALCERAGTPDVLVAVRSSAVAEDGDEASWAGQHETVLGVRGAEAVLDAVRRCRAPSVRARAYAGHEDVGAVAVAVQVLVAPLVSGVAFTVGPVTGDRSLVALNASWGLGHPVVSGEVDPDEVWLFRAGPTVVRRRVARKTVRWVVTGDGVAAEPVPPHLQDVPCLDDADAVRVAEAALAVDARAGCPQDVEWALLAGGRLVLLQARPETTWRHALARARAAAPAPGWLSAIQEAAVMRAGTDLSGER